MIGNPIACRLRLAEGLLELREQAGHTHKSLAALTKSTPGMPVSATTVSRIENPVDHISRRLNLATVRRILDVLGVDRKSAQWRDLDAWAEAGASGGWWDDPAHARMGAGQRTAAVIEAGASRIVEYANALMPGLVQTQEYAAYRAEVGELGDNGPVDVDAIVSGRMRRQAEVIDAGVPYRLVVEEQVIRRRSAPPLVMAEQLYHLLKLAERPNVSVRIVPVDGDIANGVGATAREPFTLVSYPQAGAPQIVTVDTSSGTSVLTGVKAVTGYARLHERLCSAALSDADSAAVIRDVAGRMSATK